MIRSFHLADLFTLGNGACGTGAMGRWLGPALETLAAPGSYILANQALDVARWQRLPEPPDVPKDRYFLYRVR